jgi:hypothetical protein
LENSKFNNSIDKCIDIIRDINGKKLKLKRIKERNFDLKFSKEISKSAHNCVFLEQFLRKI